MHSVLLLTVVCCCSPIYDAYCQKHYANGHCDYGCNNEECNWDGLDCEQQQPKVAEGMLYFVVLMSMQTFREHLVTFLREVSAAVTVCLCTQYSECNNWAVMAVVRHSSDQSVC